MKSVYWPIIEQVRRRHTVSKLYQPLSLIPFGDQQASKKIRKLEEISSRSSRLLTDLGIIKSSGPGSFSLLPLGLRSLEKLIKIIDTHMSAIGGQKIQLPHITQGTLWKKSGRWEKMGPELYKLKDRQNRDLILSPTHEESITSLVAASKLSVNELSLRLYQISHKFRDEMKPKFGPIRANEFVMKDLYTFDKDEEGARNTYEEVSEAYIRIFEQLGVPFVRVAGDSGNMGGTHSHEFHYPAAIGEDSLMWCSACSAGCNSEVDPATRCTRCGQELQETRGIEVGHTFLLGDRYSGVFSAQFLGEKRKQEVLQMGCYGIGVSRVMASAVEVLSTEDQIRWPKPIAPFSVCIILPKKGSKEIGSMVFYDELYKRLSTLYPDDIIVDDREKLTVGKRLQDASKTGYPVVILFGKKSVAEVPQLEVHLLNENRTVDLSPEQIFDFLAENK